MKFYVWMCCPTVRWETEEPRLSFSRTGEAVWSCSSFRKRAVAREKLCPVIAVPTVDLGKTGGTGYCHRQQFLCLKNEEYLLRKGFRPVRIEGPSREESLDFVSERPETYENPHYFRMEQLQNSAILHRPKVFDLCELDRLAERTGLIWFQNSQKPSDSGTFSCDRISGSVSVRTRRRFSNCAVACLPCISVKWKPAVDLSVSVPKWVSAAIALGVH